MVQTSDFCDTKQSRTVTAIGNPSQIIGSRFVGVDVIQNRQLIGDAFPNYAEDVETVIHVRRGGDIDSQQLGQIMIEYLREAGVEFEFGDVISIEKSNGYAVEYKNVDRVQTVRSDVVNAAGPFAKDVAKMLGVKLDLFNIYQQSRLQLHLKTTNT